jgi:nucleoside-diphosphate-sugar epimerase
MNVFVTGASSPLGLAVIRRLAGEGNKIYGMAGGVQDAKTVRSLGGMPVYADLSRASEIRSVLKMAAADALIHLEPMLTNGLPFRPARWNPRELLEQTTALVEAAQDAGAKFFIYTSYAFLYAPSEWPVDEMGEMLPDEDDPLVEAAIEAEKRVLSATIPACVLRAGFIYGPTLPETIALGETLRTARPVASGSDDHYANWIHVDDLAEAIALTAKVQPGGAILNVVDDQPTPSARFLATFADELGVKGPGRGPSFVDRLLSGRINSSLLERSAQARNDLAKRVLGWSPKFPTQVEGINDTLLTWRAQVR